MFRRGGRTRRTSLRLAGHQRHDEREDQGQCAADHGSAWRALSTGKILKIGRNKGATPSPNDYLRVRWDDFNGTFVNRPNIAPR